MAVSVLFKKPTPGEIGEIKLDCTISDVHDYQSTITKYPVEDGTNISDHIINNPETITITGFITNSPISSIIAPIANLVRRGGENRVKLAFGTLTDIRDAKLPVNVVTGLKTYRGMYLQSINIPRDARTGDSLRFTAIFTRILKVNSQVVPIQNLAQDTEGVKAGTVDTASETVDKGTQTTSAANNGQVTRTSVALKMARKSRAGIADLTQAFSQLFGGE